MRRIHQDVWTYLDSENKGKYFSIKKIREDSGYFIDNFQKLIEIIAEIQFKNPDFLLFYRGQDQDYKNQNGLTKIYPEIFRSRRNYLQADELQERYSFLNRAEKELTIHYNLDGSGRIKRYRILRWAILQHYKVCPTPLLDVTQSLRVACSFAFLKDLANDPYLMVLGLPQVSGSVTASSENALQIIRLLSICPPSALRPHYQEGYLVGEFPDVSTYREKQNYNRDEMDLSRRLIAKFRLSRNSFWNNDLFPQMLEYALMPNDRDELYKITNRITDEINRSGDN